MALKWKSDLTITEAVSEVMHLLLTISSFVWEFIDCDLIFIVLLLPILFNILTFLPNICNEFICGYSFSRDCNVVGTNSDLTSSRIYTCQLVSYCIEEDQKKGEAVNCNNRKILIGYLNRILLSRFPIDIFFYHSNNIYDGYRKYRYSNAVSKEE